MTTTMHKQSFQPFKFYNYFSKHVISLTFYYC